MTFDKKNFYISVGNLLKKYRSREDKTQDEISDVLEINRASYANFESGRQRIPTDVIWRLSVYYRIPIKNLVPEPLVEDTEESDMLSDSGEDFLLQRSESSEKDPLSFFS